jgi:hypothetical protein
MSTRSVTAGRWAAAAAVVVLAIWLTAQVGAVVAAGPETIASQPVVGQALPTPTPFRFLTPTPFVPRVTTTSPSTTTTTTTTAPRAGGFPMELAFPILAGGLAAIGGGSLVLRRKSPR